MRHSLLLVSVVACASAGTACGREQVLHADSPDEIAESDLADARAVEWPGGGEFWATPDTAADEAYMARRCLERFHVDERVVVRDHVTAPEPGPVFVGAIFDIFAMLATKGRYHDTAFTSLGAAASTHDHVVTMGERVRYSCGR